MIVAIKFYYVFFFKQDLVKGEFPTGLFLQGGDGKRGRRQRTDPKPDPDEWKKRCADLLALMLDCEDAAPFKEPVDLVLYPVSPSVPLVHFPPIS